MEVTREDIIQSIVYLGLKNNLVLFGGYLRDGEILNRIGDVKDLDLVYFNDNEYKLFLDCLILVGLFWTKIKEVKITRRLVKTYGGWSKSVEQVTTLQISSFKTSKRIPEKLKLKIDLVKIQGSKHSWMKRRDCDFSCNLFVMDNDGLKLRYVPDELQEKIHTSLIPFTADTYIKKCTRNKEFFIVMTDLMYDYQYLRLLKRTKMMMDRGWKLVVRPDGSIYPFLITDKIKVSKYDDNLCPICLKSLQRTNKNCILPCEHVICASCMVDYVENHISSRNKNKLVCPTCRTRLII